LEKWKKVIKDFVPPVVARFITGFFYGWHGNFSSWNEAVEKSGGYDSQIILEKVKISALKVKNGLAAYERDSLIFDHVEYSFSLLSGLMWIAAQNNGKLNVMDFGGSLGSSYFQNKLFLDSLTDVNWCIVEQPGFVKTGIESFEDKNLHFFDSIDACLNSYDIDVMILSSVIQYVEKPFILLDQIISTGINYLIIDRTPFIEGTDRITVQKVHPKIYRGSYPCWFFNEEKFLARIKKDYDLVVEFDALDKANISSKFKGFIFKKNIEVHIND
jgi:putative methyltransferase (TIGR04325 family)